MVVDGQWDIRQGLVHECSAKGIAIGAHFHSFYDVRKQFALFYPDAEVGRKTLPNIARHLDIDIPPGKRNGLCECQLISSVLLNILGSG